MPDSQQHGPLAGVRILEFVGRGPQPVRRHESLRWARLPSASVMRGRPTAGTCGLAGVALQQGLTNGVAGRSFVTGGFVGGAARDAGVTDVSPSSEVRIVRAHPGETENG